MPKTATPSLYSGLRKKSRTDVNYLAGGDFAAMLRSSAATSAWQERLRDAGTTPTKKRQEDIQWEESWRGVDIFLENYQKNILSDVRELVGSTRKFHSFGDSKIREVVLEVGMQSAFGRMKSRVEDRRRREKARAARYPGPLAVASFVSLVATQNRFVENELVRKLGLISGAQLDELLSIRADHGFITSQHARLEEWVQEKLAEAQEISDKDTSRLTSSIDALGTPAIDVDDLEGPTDFSDISDGRWEAELELARQEAELVRARDEANIKPLVRGVVGNTSHDTTARLQSLNVHDESPPPLVSDSDSGSESETDNGTRSNTRPKTYVGKLKSCLKKQGGTLKNVHGKKSVTLSSITESSATPPVGDGAVPAAADAASSVKRKSCEDDAASSSTRFVANSAATSSTIVGGTRTTSSGKNQRHKSSGMVEADSNMEEYSVVEGWVRNVAAGRATARGVQLHRFLRGRVEKSVISLVLESFGKDVRGAVIACARMLDPPVSLSTENKESTPDLDHSAKPVTGSRGVNGSDATTIQRRGGEGGGGVATAEVGGGVDGSHNRNDDSDIHSADTNAISNRANYLLHNGCQDDGRLQALLDKAKGKDGIKMVRKKLAKAIKDLKKQRREEEQRQQVGETHVAATGSSRLLTIGDGDVRGASFYRGDIGSDSASGGGRGLDRDGGETHKITVYTANPTRNSENAFDALRDPGSAGAADVSGSGVHDQLIKHAEELVANGCQDERKLETLLTRARGKVGLAKTREMLKRAIKDIARRQDFEAFTFTSAGVAARDGASKSAKANVNDSNKHKANISGGGNTKLYGDKQGSALLTITRTVAKQLDKQRREWPRGHVRQILRCRPGLVPKVVGRHGIALKNIETKTGAKVDVLRDTTNDKYHRTVTVRGVPENVNHAVVLICEIVGDSVVVNELELSDAGQQAGEGSEPRSPHIGDGGKANDACEVTATAAAHAATNQTKQPHNANTSRSEVDDIVDGEGVAFQSTVGDSSSTAAGVSSDVTSDIATWDNPVARSGGCGEEDAEFHGGLNDSVVHNSGEGDGDGGVIWSSPSGMPPRSALDTYPGLQGTKDMVERLTAPTSRKHEQRSSGNSCLGEGKAELEGNANELVADGDKGGKGDGLGCRKDPSAVPPRSTLHTDSGVQDADVMIERLTAVTRSGQPRSPAQQGHPAGTAASPASTPSAGRFFSGSPSQAYRQVAATSPINPSCGGSPPGRQGYSPHGPPDGVGGSGSGGVSHSNSQIGRSPQAAESRTPVLDGSVDLRGGGFADVNASGSTARLRAPPGFSAADSISAVSSDPNTHGPAPAQYSGATGTTRLHYLTPVRESAGACPSTAGHAPTAAWHGAGQVFTPGMTPSPAHICNATVAEAVTGSPYMPTAGTRASAAVGYPGTSTPAAAAVEYLASAAYHHVDHAFGPASVVPSISVGGYVDAAAAANAPSVSTFGAPATAADVTTTASPAAPALTPHLPPAQSAMDYRSLLRTVDEPAQTAKDQSKQRINGHKHGRHDEGKGTRYFNEYDGEGSKTANVPRGGDDRVSTKGGTLTGGGDWGQGDGNLAQKIPLDTRETGNRFNRGGGGVKGGGGGGGGGGPRGKNTKSLMNNDLSSTIAQGWGDSCAQGWGDSYEKVEGGGAVKGTNDEGSSGVTRCGTGASIPDPHVEAVLMAAKCERFLPLFVAKKIDLRKLARMDDADFKMLQNDKDPRATRVPRGPQLKILHHCKKKLEELGITITEEEGDPGNPKEDSKKGDSDGMCTVCWEEEIQITFCPCGHQACCFTCGKNLEKKNCPICRKLVEMAVRFYTA